MKWTEARIEVLRRMASAGATYGEVARALGSGCTRNMVAGKAYRLGVKFAPSPDKLSRAARAFQATLTEGQKAVIYQNSLGKGRATHSANCAAKKGAS